MIVQFTKIISFSNCYGEEKVFMIDTDYTVNFWVGPVAKGDLRLDPEGTPIGLNCSARRFREWVCNGTIKIVR